MELSARFREVVTSEAQFRAVMGHPAPRTLDKELAYLDDFCRTFISRSPFVVISSCDAEGRMDVSPRGDPAGFVRVLDEHTLAIPDRPGNRRADTFKNILQNEHVGLLFMIPGKHETLRVSGRAIVVRDADLRETMAVGGRLPDFAIVVAVEQAFFQCAKCMIRSNMWNTKAWPPLAGLPSQAETIVAAARLDISVDEMQAIIDKDRETRLY
jgi:PPOX class probable FMN-dependent enzyme